MRPLTDREKKIIAAAAVVAVLCLGFQGWKLLEKTRADYNSLVVEAQAFREKINPYQQRAQVVEKLMAEFHLDPAKLSRQTLVADTSAAIQKAATGSGVALGPVRESHGRASARELATMQIQANGQLPGVIAFLQRLGTLGFPVVVESAQVTSEPMRPGALKLNLTITILDFDQWKKAEVPGA
jgi:hypothetical protein